MRRARTQAVVAAAVATVIATTALPAIAAPAPSSRTGLGLRAPAPERPPGLRLQQTRVSLTGTHRWYVQTWRGHPVVGGWYAVHVSPNGRPHVEDGLVHVVSPRLVTDPVPGRVAVAAATDRSAVLRASAQGLRWLPGAAGAPARLVHAVHTVTPHDARLVYVDAATAQVVGSQVVSAAASDDRRSPHEGRGRVFVTNPVVQLQAPHLRDRGDANAAVPARAYRKVTLHRLDGTGQLRGRWAAIVNRDAPQRADARFLYRRRHDRFEMVNAYRAVDRAQVFLQSLGFTDAQASSQQIQTGAWSADQSYYDAASDRILFGSGGVDDAEDPEIVWHEYAHAVLDDQVPGFGYGNQAAAIGEGFGDYFAGVMALPVSRATRVTPAACVGDWDATSYRRRAPRCVRRLDTRRHYPQDMVYEPHRDGQIWSGALWTIRRKLGRARATRIIVEAQFRFHPSIGFHAAADRTVRTARHLCGRRCARVARRAFRDRGLL